MNKEEYRTGLWKKQAKSGITYCSGKIKLGDREFQVVLFNNDKKGNEKAPDFNLILKDNINIQEKEKQSENVLKIEPSKGLDEKIFEDFGNNIEISEDEYPF